MEKNDTNPQVRFAGFTEDWEERELAKILTERKSLQRISLEAPILAFAAGQGVIDRSERKSNNRDHLTLDQENKIYKLTELNDIVYNPSNLKYGAIDRNKHGRGVISPIYVTFTTEEEPSFVELIVKSEKFKRNALRFEEGSVVKRQSVKPEYLLAQKVKISINHDEQKKIGIMFEFLDNIIDVRKIKHKKLIGLKNEMLQKMFPKVGKDVPEIRFKNYKEKWQSIQLSEITKKVIDKNTHFEITETFTNSAELGIISQRDFFDHDKSNKENLNNYYIVENDDFVYNPRISKLAPVGPINRNRLSRTGVMSPLYCVFRPYNIDLTFLEQYFKSKHWHSFMKLNGDSGARADRFSIKDSVFFEMPIPQPDINEQIMIGKYLSNIDNLITLSEKQINKLEYIKLATFSKMIY